MLRRQHPPGTATPPSVDKALLTSTARQLDRLAANLSERERTALFTILHAAAPDRARKALRRLPPEAVLSSAEIAVLDRLLALPNPEGQGLQSSLSVMMKGTRRCNLRCSYCHFWSDGPNQRMSFEVLARTTRSVLVTPGVKAVQFIWHGGEPTLLPISFYRKALWLQQRFCRPGQRVENVLQTNGTLLSPEWLAFLRDYQIDVGVSLDGPPEIHDRHRRDAAGRPTASRVREAIESLRESGIEPGVIFVVGEDIVEYGARRLLDYFLEAGISRVSLINVVPENTPPGEPIRGAFLPEHRYVEFLREVFRVWWPALVDRITVREVSDLFTRARSEGAGSVCLFQGNCMGRFLTVEPSGEISACEKYRGDAGYQFGNILEIEIADIPSTKQFVRINEYTATGIATASGCPWFAVCQGGCPHDRYLRTNLGATHDEQCCGLSPLLADMAEAVGIGRGEFSTSNR